MTENSHELNVPAISAVLALAGPLRPLSAGAHPLHETARQEISARIGWLLEALGIPGKLEVSLEDGETGKAPGPVLSLTVHGHPCSLAGEMVSPFLDHMTQNKVGSRVNMRLLLDILKETCLEILKSMPEVLLELPQAEAVAREMVRPRRRKGVSLPNWPPDPAILLPALRVPVGLGISIANRLDAAQIIGSNVSSWEAPEDLGELLAGGLAVDRISIWLPQERFRELTLTWQEKGGEGFSQARVDLAKETGLKVPPYTFQPVANLGADQFEIQIQHIPSIPFTGLTQDNLVKMLGSEIRRLLPRLVVMPQVEAQLELVDSELQDMVQERIPLPYLTRELRQQAQQYTGLRRLPQILEDLLDAPFAAAGAPGSLALK